MEKQNKSGKRRVVNLSGCPLKLKLSNLIGLRKLIIFPDYSPNRGLPTGTVAVFERAKHEVNPEYIGPDVGCGMLLGRLIFRPEYLEDIINGIAEKILGRRDEIGTLGGGNHFVTLYETSKTFSSSFPLGDTFVLIHSGSRNKGITFYKMGLKGDDYLNQQGKIIAIAQENRERILDKVKKEAGKVEVILDKPHNYISLENEEVVYRKGTVRVMPGELLIIPSSMGGSAALVRVEDTVSQLHHSLPHATGRKISRGDAMRQEFFHDGFPKNVYVPYFIYPESLNAELPPNYRHLEEVLSKIKSYLTIEAILSPIASIM